MLKHPRRMFSTVAVFWLLLDFVSKQWVTNSMELGQTIPVWEGVFQLRYMRNYGAAFSLMQGQTLLFFAAMIVLVLMVIWFWWTDRPKHWIPVVTTALVLAGALGNTFDRAVTGSVIDMFSLQFVDFPVFNVADIGIVTGCILFLFWYLFMSGHVIAKPQTDQTHLQLSQEKSDLALQDESSVSPVQVTQDKAVAEEKLMLSEDKPSSTEKEQQALGNDKKVKSESKPERTPLKARLKQSLRKMEEELDRHD